MTFIIGCFFFGSMVLTLSFLGRIMEDFPTEPEYFIGFGVSLCVFIATVVLMVNGVGVPK